MPWGCSSNEISLGFRLGPDLYTNNERRYVFFLRLDWPLLLEQFCGKSCGVCPLDFQLCMVHNKVNSIDSLWSSSLDSQCHPAIYWAKSMLWEHSSL